MSEKQEHRKRYAARYEYLNKLEKWLDNMPPWWKIAKRIRWKKERPVLYPIVNQSAGTITVCPMEIVVGKP